MGIVLIKRNSSDIMTGLNTGSNAQDGLIFKPVLTMYTFTDHSVRS